MNRTRLFVPLATLLFTCLWLSLVRTADAQTRFSPGDKVEVNWGGWKPGTVIELSRNGWIKVKVRSEGGVEQTPTLPPSSFRMSVGGTTGPTESGPSATGSKTRMWTDITGKFKMEAKFVRLKDGQVTLQKADGKEITLPIAKLSPMDQQFVTTQSAPESANPFDSPSGGANLSDGPSADFDDDMDERASVKVTKTNLLTATPIMPSNPGSWSVTPDPASNVPQKLTNRPIPLERPQGGGQAAFFEKVVALLFQASEGIVYLVHHDSFDNVSTRLEKCDLVRGKSLGSITMPVANVPCDIDPSGKRIVATSDLSESMSSERVDVWDISGKEPEHVVSWKPFASGESILRDVSFAAFVDADHVVTAGRTGQMALWQLPDLRAVYSLSLHSLSEPAFSPGRKQLAVATKQGLFILDARTGKTLGQLDGHLDHQIRFCFSDDGRHLAALSQMMVQVWDLGSGERTGEVFFPKTIPVQRISWIDDGHLLVNGAKLIDLKRRIVLWDYQQPGQPMPSANFAGRQWYTLKTPNGASGLVPLVLPHAEARQTADRLDPDSLLAVKPGAAVTIQINASVSQQERKQVYDSLASRLTKQGMQVVQGSRLILEASTASGKTEEVTYSNPGQFGGGDTTQITQQIHKLVFTENGREVWEVRQIKGAPAIVQIKKGQSIDSAVAEGMKPNIGFFLSAPLPQHVARHGEKGAYGSSTITPEGIK